MTGAIAPTGHPAAYDILVGLHVVCVVIGFGSVALSGAYGAIGRHAGQVGPGGQIDRGGQVGPGGQIGRGGQVGPGVGPSGDRSRPEMVSELRRFFASDSKLGWFLVVGPVFGVAAMAVRPGGSEFGDVWAIAGVVIWLVASALLVAVVRPAERQVQRSVAGPPDAEPPLPTAELGVACRRLLWASAACDLMFVIALFLMVTQPH